MECGFVGCLAQLAVDVQLAAKVTAFFFDVLVVKAQAAAGEFGQLLQKLANHPLVQRLFLAHG